MIDKLSLLFSLAPVYRGFIAMCICGSSFPLCGVMVLRMNLVPLRYMLMHGVILGGAIALAFSLPTVLMCILVNILLVFLMIFLNQSNKFGFNGASSTTMILSMAAASLLMHLADVPAKDTLNLLWGSPFALVNTDLILLGIIVFILIFYLVLNFKNITALFFNNEIAQSLGIKIRLNYIFMVLIIATVVAVAMKLLGAFLIDALLILPVITACSLQIKKSGIKRLFVLSSILGLFFSISGYLIAVMFNLPPAATIALIAGAIYLISFLRKKLNSGDLK